MGHSITVSCKKCSAQDDFNIGIGFSHFEIESVLPHLRGKSKETLKDIINKQQVHDSDYGYAVYVCDNCNTLHNRFYVKVEYKNSDGNKEIFETHFQCAKCRKPIKKLEEFEGDIEEDIEKSIRQYSCKECGAKALKQHLSMFWD